jgi:hypothetical protein
VCGEKNDPKMFEFFTLAKNKDKIQAPVTFTSSDTTYNIFVGEDGWNTNQLWRKWQKKKIPE